MSIARFRKLLELKSVFELKFFFAVAVAKIMGIVNLKGGAGKTATAVNLIRKRINPMLAEEIIKKTEVFHNEERQSWRGA